MQKFISRVRRHGGSIGTTLPREIIQSLDIKPGDIIHWRVSRDITLEFFKVIQPLTPAEVEYRAQEEQEQVLEAPP